MTLYLTKVYQEVRQPDFFYVSWVFLVTEFMLSNVNNVIRNI